MRGKVAMRRVAGQFSPLAADGLDLCIFDRGTPIGSMLPTASSSTDDVMLR